jgi:integrase
MHDLRHAGPTILMAQGVPDAVIRKLTGHRSRELSRYQHLSMGLKRRTVDLIAAQLSTPTGTRDEADPQD